MSDKPISRQRKWQLARLAEGKCKLCGRPRDKDSAEFCSAHRKSVREMHRRRRAAIDKKNAACRS
jgi:hypothetical protein